MEEQIELVRKCNMKQKKAAWKDTESKKDSKNEREGRKRRKQSSQGRKHDFEGSDEMGKEWWRISDKRENKAKRRDTIRVPAGRNRD